MKVLNSEWIRILRQNSDKSQDFSKLVGAGSKHEKWKTNKIFQSLWKIKNFQGKCLMHGQKAYSRKMFAQIWKYTFTPRFFFGIYGTFKRGVDQNSRYWFVFRSWNITLWEASKTIEWLVEVATRQTLALLTFLISQSTLMHLHEPGKTKSAWPFIQDNQAPKSSWISCFFALLIIFAMTDGLLWAVTCSTHVQSRCE